MTQTVPDISPLMPMHQDPLLVYFFWVQILIGPPQHSSLQCIWWGLDLLGLDSLEHIIPWGCIQTVREVINCTSWPCFKIKTIFPDKGIPLINTHWSTDCPISIMGISSQSFVKIRNTAHALLNSTVTPGTHYTNSQGSISFRVQMQIRV